MFPAGGAALWDGHVGADGCDEGGVLGDQGGGDRYGVGVGFGGWSGGGVGHVCVGQDDALAVEIGAGAGAVADGEWERSLPDPSRRGIS